MRQLKFRTLKSIWCFVVSTRYSGVLPFRDLHIMRAADSNLWYVCFRTPSAQKNPSLLGWMQVSPAHITIKYTKRKSFLLMLLLFVSLFPVSFSVCEADSSMSNDQKLLFYVFGSDAIYIIDPESKTVLSKIEAEGVCTKSNDRYSR